MAVEPALGGIMMGVGTEMKCGIVRRKADGVRDAVEDWTEKGKR